MSIIPRGPFGVARRQTGGSVDATTTENVLRNVTTAEETAREIIERRPSLAARLGFGSSVDKARSKAEANIARVEWEAIEKTVFLIRGAATQALEESLNAVLLKGQAGLRSETLAFMTQKMKDLREEIRRMSKDVAAGAAAHAATADTIDFEPSKEMLLVQAEEELIQFKTWCDQVVGKFHSLLDEWIKADEKAG